MKTTYTLSTFRTGCSAFIKNVSSISEGLKALKATGFDIAEVRTHVVQTGHFTIDNQQFCHHFFGPDGREYGYIFHEPISGNMTVFPDGREWDPSLKNGLKLNPHFPA